MCAEYRVAGGVAVITLDNPPINGLDLATRRAAFDGIRRARADAAVSAIVITGAGKVFSGGADIREFDSPSALTEPTLYALIEAAESSPKPVLAAMRGVCVGGGLELALACHYRIAAAGTLVGLPEVKLGLLPGAGGTQRLPRALGLEAALDMIVSGAPVAAGKLAAGALFDDIVADDDDLAGAAIGLAGRVAALRPLPRVRERAVAHADGAAFVRAARARVDAEAGPYPAPRRCVEAVAASLTLPFEDGLRFERALFMRLLASAESKALRHAFFAERGAGKVPDLPADTPLRPIRAAAVVGAGAMGRGIAMSLLDAGIPVTLLDTDQATLDLALAAIRAGYGHALQKGKLTRDALARRLALLDATLAWPDIAEADIVIEAVYEDDGAKRAVFERLGQVMKPGAILASNTSTLDLDRLAAASGRPRDVIGTHFFNPANVMKLLEIVRGAATGKDVLATTLALSKRLRKTGVVAGVCDGFIGNRMLRPYLRQAELLLEEGCSPQQVDQAAERFGFAMGPFRMSDLAGNDIGWAIRRRHYLASPRSARWRNADALCAMGRFGQKSGAGWYDYPAGERLGRPSAVVSDMLARNAAAAGAPPPAIGEAEIVERLVYALVNEGARVLEDGIALRAADIDMVYLGGYGFPPFRGGPMFYADTVGLPLVLGAIERHAAGRHGDAWTPAPLLVRLAAAGGSFNG